MKKTLLAFLGILALVSFTVSATASAAPASQSAPIERQASANVPISPSTGPAASNLADEAARIKKEVELTSQLEVLKDKNQLLSEFQNTLISTVLWCLGITVSVVLLLVGASFFTNFKVHEKDIQRISNDYDSKVKIFRSDLDAELANVSRDFAEMHESRSQQDLDRQLDQLNGIRQEFATVRSNFDLKQEESRSQIASLDKLVRGLLAKHTALLSEFRRAETKIWELKKIPLNEYLSALQGLENALEAESDWEIDDFAKIVKQILEDYFVTKEHQLTEFCKEYGEKIINSLLAKRPEIAGEIFDVLGTVSYRD